MMIDNMVCEFMHMLCESAGGFFTPFFRLISILGEKCWLCVLIGFILCVRKKSRWVGVTIVLSIFLGFLVADFVLKPCIMRLRPYLSDITRYYRYWQDAGAIEETGYSMPSGHTLGVTAFFTSLYITAKQEKRKTIMIVGIICIVLMAMSRCYFMHHYFTDCLAGAIVAIIIACITKVLVKLIYKICKVNA